MSTVIDEDAVPTGTSGSPTPATLPRTWTLTWHGIRTVAELELRQRIRSTRWIVALVVWFVVVGAITGLVWLSTRNAMAPADGLDPNVRSYQGPMMFGLVVFFVLFLGLLVAPTLSATSINGDRSAGTLAILQVTLLSPFEIVLGKLLASWAAALAFLVVSVPFIGIALGAGGTPVLAMFVCLAVLALLLAAVCAIGLGFSALTARTSGSAVLTYIAVASLSALSPIVFGLTYLTTTHDETVRVWTVPASGWNGNADTAPACVWDEQVQSVSHTERTWWLLAINPFVIVADAAPQPSSETYRMISGDPLGSIRNGVRSLRAGPAHEVDQCWSQQSLSSDYVSPVTKPDVDTSAVWPWGLGANLLLGAAGVWLAVRRLRIPQRTLARGTRVA
ncbi:MAG TPA: ABC transporter permease subunit [Cellulomonas sp.]|uniref:ABC transporter permease n=1 Tax=Cellulomonas sp. TaxID=40001 RepID=UPI002E311406|nr:ABC transporter permease subunit [Cellulomonas sp.]HEX5333937.1 ABC transporter permease subunit [Cellulomonas sp.]